MARQHQYRVTFYDQQGTCHQVELSTVYQIRRDPNVISVCSTPGSAWVGRDAGAHDTAKTGLEQEISIINARLI